MNSTLGEKLKSLRTLVGLSQAEMADFLGIDRSAYCCYEINRAKPDIYNLARLAKLFHVSTDYLLFPETELQDQVEQYKSDIANAKPPASIFDETFLTLSDRERAMIVQWRIVPDRDELLEMVHQRCAEYMKGDNKLFPALNKTREKRRAAHSNQGNPGQDLPEDNVQG